MPVTQWAQLMATMVVFFHKASLPHFHYFENVLQDFSAPCKYTDLATMDNYPSTELEQETGHSQVFVSLNELFKGSQNAQLMVDHRLTRVTHPAPTLTSQGCSVPRGLPIPLPGHHPCPPGPLHMLCLTPKEPHLLLPQPGRPVL